MPRTNVPSIASIARLLKAELQPTEGRLGATWRVAAICALSAMLFMVYQVPLVAIGCYLVLFLIRTNLTESLLMGLAICILVALIVPLLVLLTQIGINSALWRMVIIAVASFLFLYLGAASKVGPLGGIVGLVVAFIMTLLGMVPEGELATRGILYAWLMVLIPMGVLISFLAFTAPSPVKKLRAVIQRRFELIANHLTGQASLDTLQHALQEGNAPFGLYTIFTKAFYVTNRAEQQRLQAGLEGSWQALFAATALPEGALSDAQRHALASRYQDLAHAYAQGQTAPSAARDLTAWPLKPDGAAARLVECAVQLPNALQQSAQPPKDGFFFADALTNPNYQYYAIKTTLAAVFCYVTYTTLQWDGIHTAMITCYIVALGTSGETIHKLTLRILGCLVGAAMGIAAVTWLMPRMTSIGELMLLVFAGVLVAGWVSTGSERIAYAGVQVGLAFLLTVLQGFGPDVNIDVARDRIVGILLGNAAMYLLFTRVWTYTTLEATYRGLAQLSQYGRQHCLPTLEAAQLQSLAPYVWGQLQTVREQMDYIWFEPQSLRRAIPDLHAYVQVPEQMEHAYQRAAFPSDHGPTTAFNQLDGALTQLENSLVTLQPTSSS